MINWIGEENFEERMHSEAEPYLAQRMESGFFERAVGEPIYYEHYKADSPKGVIVISHGFTETIKKSWRRPSPSFNPLSKSNIYD